MDNHLISNLLFRFSILIDLILFQIFSSISKDFFHLMMHKFYTLITNYCHKNIVPKKLIEILHPLIEEYSILSFKT